MKSLPPVLSYFNSISFQTRTKKLNNFRNCRKLQVVFENKTRLGNVFNSKIAFPKMLVLVVFTSLIVNETLDCKNRWTGGYITDYRLYHKIKPKNSSLDEPKNSPVDDNFLFSNHLVSFELNILTSGSKKHLLESRVSLLIMIDQPFLNKKHFLYEKFLTLFY